MKKLLRLAVKTALTAAKFAFADSVIIALIRGGGFCSCSNGFNRRGKKIFQSIRAAMSWRRYFNTLSSILLVLSVAIVLLLVCNPVKTQARQLVEPAVEAKIGQMTLENVRLIINQAAASWTNGDAKAFAALFVAKGEFVVPGQKWIGAAAIEQAAAEFARSNAQVNIKIQRILVDHQQAVVEWRWEEIESSGKRTQADDAIVVDFVDGKIQRWREYIDSRTPSLE